MASDIQLKDARCVLVVEGYSDLRFYAEMLESLGLRSGEVFIKQFNGKADVKKQLEAFITPQLLDEKEAIGIAVDADADAAGTFQSFQATLKEITAQEAPSPGSWTGGNPKVGIFIAPSAQDSGELETLVWRSWAANPANKDARKCIQDYIRCMKAAGLPAKSPDKALIGALLAMRNDDDPRLGPGAQANVFDLCHPVFQELRDFLGGFRG